MGFGPTFKEQSWENLGNLGAIHTFQHFHECTNHTLLEGGGICENQHFFHTLLTFWPDFYYFHGDF